MFTAVMGVARRTGLHVTECWKRINNGWIFHETPTGYIWEEPES